MEKDTSVNELDATFVIENFEIKKLIADVKWVVVPSSEILKHQLHTIAIDIAKGANNRLCQET